MNADVLRIQVPEPAALERLAASGVLHGRVRELRVEVRTVPPFLRGGLRAAGTSRDSTLVSWQATGPSAEARLGWRRPKDLSRGLDEMLGMMQRRGNGRWAQPGGPDVTSLDPDPARSVNAELATAGESDNSGNPENSGNPGNSGNSGNSGNDDNDATAGEAREPDAADVRESDATRRTEPQVATVAGLFGGPLGTSAAFPVGRAMVGDAARYRLEASPQHPDRLLLTEHDTGRTALTFDPATTVEQPLLDREWRKYATVRVGDAHPDHEFGNRVLLGLAACGVVPVPDSDVVAARLDRLGLVTVDDPDQVSDVPGYRISATASRTAALLGDPLLARSALAPHWAEGTDRAGGPLDRTRVPLPTISVLIASKRQEDVLGCLRAMANQDYPAYEVLLGTHGYRLDEDVRREFEQKLTLRALPIDASATLGQMLGTLSRAADGDLLAKVDDDDHYGPDHLRDLLLAIRCSGADLVAKSARFVQLADADVTIDRTWSAPEAFEVVPAGGTILVSRAALTGCGGWSESPKHVDAELIQRIRTAGGATYRTHGLGYVYVRRNSGHTWQADPDSLRTENEVRYPGLPTGILTGGSL